MDMFHLVFPVSQVETSVFLPPLVALVVSFFTSMAGVSGAFILLPFQMSVLGFTSPAVSSTNFVYNIVAIPSGVYRYFKEGRMAWPLTWVVVAGTLPGVFIGYYLRVLYLPDPRAFKLFVGVVLLYIGARLIYEILPAAKAAAAGQRAASRRFDEQMRSLRSRPGSDTGQAPMSKVRTLRFDMAAVEYEFWGERFGFSVPAMLLLSFLVGIVGGTYGIGGGAIIAPFCVVIFRLPVYTVAGAALFGTFLTSLAGVFFYSVLPAQSGLATSPDWALGALFGAGGFVGMYLGARFQKFVAQDLIKAMLGGLILFLAAGYIAQFFRP